MTEEQENKEKRKRIPLTKKEWLVLIFTPYFASNDFDESEYKRFEKHGFTKKTEQMETARFLSRIIYLALIYSILWFFLKD